MQRILLFGCFLVISSSVCAQSINLLTEIYRPYQYEDTQGNPVGFGIDLVMEMFRRGGVAVDGGQAKILPWARAYHILETTPNSATFLTVRNQIREQRFHWVGPLAPRHMDLYKLKSRDDIQIKTIEDVKNYTVGGYNKSASTDYMQELGMTQITIVTDPGQLVKMLILGRLDLIPSLRLQMAMELQDLGKDFSMVENAFPLDHRFQYYLALNKGTPLELVEKLQKSLDSIRADGSYQKLYDHYMDNLK